MSKRTLGTVIPFPLPELQPDYYEDAHDRQRSLRALREIADTTNRAACRLDRSQRWGRKVFISDVMRKLRVPRDQEAWYKRKLVHANTEGFVTLTRFDLVGAGDPKTVARSAIELRPQGRHENLAEFHLLTLKCD